jgi:hypothetical protein
MKKSLLSYLALMLMFVVSLTTSCSKEDKVILDQPQDLSYGSYGLKIELSWSKVDKAEGYYIYRAEGSYSDDPETLDYSKVGSTEDSVYSDTDVTPSTYYYYYIVAYSGSSKSDISEYSMGYTDALSTVEIKFSDFADATGGKLYSVDYATDVPVAINTIIDEHGSANADVVFLIDNTGSMSDDIYEVQTALSTIIANLPSGTKVGAAYYNDNNVILDDTWYGSIDLTTDYASVTTFINSLSADGGGDTPESVYDGVYNVVDQMSWSSSNKIIIVIGDAEPLEGDLTRHTYEEVIAKCTTAGIAVNLYPILIYGSKKKSANTNQ